MSDALPSVLAWLAGVPPAVLYGVLLGAAFLENLLPPVPADTVIAVGAMLAARGQGTPWGAWVATMIGNVGGALLMYALGARIGIGGLARRFPVLGTPEQAGRLGAHLTARGMAAVAVSRFLPGVRALVPPVAGAIGLPWRSTAIAMGLASAIWYGLICWVAYSAGANAEALLTRLAAHQRTLGLLAAAALVIGLGRWWWRRRGQKPESP